MGPYLTIDPQTGNPVAIYEDGSVVPVQQTQGATHAAGQPGGAAPAQQSPSPQPVWFAPEPGSDGLSGSDAAGRGAAGGDYQRRTYDRGSYQRNVYDGGGSDALPRYADGRTYPEPGAAPFDPTAGVTDAAPSFRRDLWGDGGSRAAQPAYGGGSDGSSGGGGSLARDLYWQTRNRIEGNVRSMLGGGASGGYSSSSAAPSRVPRERMRGPYAHGLDPAQAAGLSLHPTALLPRVFGGGFSPADPTYARLAAMPAAQMAMLAGGYSGSPEDLANNLGEVYRDAARGDLPSTQKMIGQFTHGKGVTSLFEGEKAGPHDTESYQAPGYVYGQEPLQMGEAATTAAGLLDAALYGEPLAVQQKYGALTPGSWGSFLIDKGSSRALKKPAGKGIPLNRFVGRRIFR